MHHLQLELTSRTTSFSFGLGFLSFSSLPIDDSLKEDGEEGGVRGGRGKPSE